MNCRSRRVPLEMTPTEKWWAMTCTKCGGFVPIRAVEDSERVAPTLQGKASCVRCNATNDLTGAALFVIDGKRLRRIRLSSPADYVK
jgi:ribosomal protein L40E